jgi:ubiquinone/menaquinone biosynthesis C-methylase UbiE
MRAAHMALLRKLLPADRACLVLDLGGGTGALAEAVAETLPLAEVEIWDIDRAMLGVARERCARFGARIRYVERSFADPLTPCDAVVACIALHHVKDLAAKGCHLPEHFHGAAAGRDFPERRHGHRRRRPAAGFFLPRMG